MLLMIFPYIEWWLLLYQQSQYALKLRDKTKTKYTVVISGICQ